MLLLISLIFANGINAKIARIILTWGRLVRMVVGTSTCAISGYHY
ncbi:MAG: hypothetical protein NZ824_02490 [Candidatus Thioglobus sp.]|nr:hypothetical protein [Candidatus Thioglobus sp.]